MTPNASVQARVLQILNEYKVQGIEEGVQVAAYHQGKLILDIVSGTITGINALRPDDMIYSWSMTKGITALAVHIAVQKHLLAYDDLVMRYWPEFGVNGKAHITAGFPQPKGKSRKA